MITPEQAERYEVEAVNVEQGFAMSSAGDIGELVLFFDNEGDFCDPMYADQALVQWPYTEICTLVVLREFISVLH